MSSPEQLDQLMQITPAKSWLALLALATVVVFSMTWSWVGRIPVTLTGGGMLLSTGGLFDIEVLGQGSVARLLVTAGQTVQSGALIAELEQPGLARDIRQQEINVQRLLEERTIKQDYWSAKLALENQTAASERATLDSQIDVINERIVWYTQQEQEQRIANQSGAISKAELQNTRLSLEQGWNDLADAELRLRSVGIRLLDLENQQILELRALDDQIVDARARLDSLTVSFEQNARVYSPYTGVIREVRIPQGQVVNTGDALVSIEQADAQLQAVGFINVLGNDIVPGMTVRLAPATIKPEEHGYLLGTVKAVSEQPATRAGMMQVLNNDTLVSQILMLGTPHRVDVALNHSAPGSQDYEWTSSVFAPPVLSSGTISELNVVVAEHPPITLVIPAFKRLFFGVESRFPQSE